MSNKTIVTVYGYGKQIAPGNRDWEGVAGDRNDSAYNILSFLNKHGIDAELYISGGTKDPQTGEAEAESMLGNMKKRHPDLERIVSDVVLDREAMNTSQNMKNMSTYAKSRGVEAIIGTTSVDHVSRAAKEGAYNNDLKGMLFGIVPSAESYSVNGSEFGPFILEPPFFPDKDTYTGFTGLFKLKPEQKKEVASVIQSYSKQ